MSAEDWAAMVNLVNCYGAAIDRFDMDAVRSCFTADAEVAYGSRSLRGPDEVAAFIQGATGAIAFQQHLLGRHQVHVDGDRATASTALTATQLFKDRPGVVLTTSGPYHDELVKGPA